MKKLIFLVTLIIACTNSKAGIITVMNTNDAGAGSLRQAIADAVSGDTVNFAPTLIATGNDTIKLSGQIDINKNLTVNGLYNATDSLYISAEGAQYVFRIVTPGLMLNFNSLILTESTFSAVFSISAVSVKNSIFKNCTSGGVGSAIHMPTSNTSLIIDSCFFTQNSSSQGGAVYCFNQQYILVKNSTFTNNATTGGQGGAIYINQTFDSVIFENNVFESNTSASSAGAIRLLDNRPAIKNVFVNNTFNSNVSITNDGGGALFISGNVVSDISFLNCSFDGNSALNDGGAINMNSTVTVDSCVFTNNSGRDGGALYSNTATISNSTFFNNNATSIAGAIRVSAGTIENSTISYNTAVSRGAMTISSGSISNSTITHNTSTGSPGMNIQATSLTISNSTIAYNSASQNSGGITASSVMLKNSIVALNTSGTSDPNITSPGLTSLGYNIFEEAVVTGSVSTDILGADSLAINLDTLDDNGGVGKTVVPLIPSVAIDAGDPSDLTDAQNRAVFNVIREIGAAESCATSSMMTVKACDSYTWTLGDNNTYTNDTVVYYTLSALNSVGCDSVLILNLHVGNTPIDIPTALDVNSHCDSGVSVIELDSSEPNYKYYLRDNSNNNVVLGPIEGTGDSVLFSTGVINTNMSYNILAQSNDAEFGVRLPLANDYINFTNSYSAYNKSITIESWVYADTGGVADLWAGQTTPATDNLTTNVWLWHQNIFYVNDAGTWRATSFPSLDTGWTHVATVADSTGLYVYYNGVLQDSSSVGISTNIVQNPASSIQLGQDPRFTAGTTNRNGDIGFSNFRVWNSSRTPQEIYNNMSKPLTGLETGLVHATRFYEGIGDTLASLVGPTGYVINSNPTNWLTKDTGCLLQMTTISSVNVNYSSTASFTQTVCDSLVSPSGNYTWKTTGMFMDTILNTSGCDSVMTFNLTVNYSSAEIFNVTVCDSLVSPSGNYTWKTTGAYMDTVLNASGCDSVMTFNLTVNYSSAEIFNDTVCDSLVSPSGNYTWKTTGTYMDTVLNASGCDSVMTFNLTVGQTYSDTVTIVACDTVFSLSSTNFWTNTGIYFDTIYSSQYGCDSSVVYDITIATSTDTVTTFSCDTVFSLSSANFWTTTGIYIDTIYSNQYSCDSTIVYDVTIGKTTTTLSPSTCDSYVSPSGNTYSITGVYYDTLTCSMGCDSIFIINLSIGSADTTVKNYQGKLIAFVSGAAYKWLDCNNSLAVIPGATGQEFIPSSAGTYALEITQSGCTDTSSCHIITSPAGINENSFGENFNVYPNPTAGLFTVNFGKALSNANITLVDVTGKVVLLKNISNTNSVVIDTDSFDKGTYFVKIENNNQVKTISIVKQ